MKDEKKVSLAVADPKLGNAINKLPSLDLTPVSDSSTADVYRAIREHMSSLIPGLAPTDIHTMSLGLSHSLSRHKLKFSPDKVDTMIIQAVSLLDDLDKELNQYAMRVKEWYGWHFPEMAKIINDNKAYARVVLTMGMRTNASKTDLSEILPEEIEVAVKGAAEVSMGTEITDEDYEEIQGLAENVVDLTDYRQSLSSYLSTRMQAIAPNLTSLVGEIVGARLIAHAGSLMNLSKSPASTIQVLGAEKALFRALKTKHDTPKYGLIYHASLIGQASGKNKGKVARMLAAKTALGLRIDALSDWGAGGAGKEAEPTDEEKVSFALDARSYLERRLRKLEGKPLKALNANLTPINEPKMGKFSVKEARKYNPDADGMTGDEPAANEAEAAPISNGVSPEKKLKKGKSKKAEEASEESEEDSDEEMADDKPTEQLSKEAQKAKRKAEKEAKKQRKAERAAKRAEKEAKKASQAAAEAEDAISSKKRKRTEETEKVEKKKKKKSKD